MRIRKLIRSILSEAERDEPHYSERMYDRFINADTLNVGFEIPGTVGEYKIIGSYVIPESIKAQIIDNARLVEKYNFPRNKSFGVMIANIMIDRNKVKYNSPEDMVESKGKPLVFVDEKTQSNGNIVYAIIRENTLKTIYFAKNYVPQTPEKLRVDVIIKNMDVIRQGKVR